MIEILSLWLYLVGVTVVLVLYFSFSNENLIYVFVFLVLLFIVLGAMIVNKCYEMMETESEQRSSKRLRKSRFLNNNYILRDIEQTNDDDYDSPYDRLRVS